MIELAKTYDEAVGFLFDRINFERTPTRDKQDFKLIRMQRLLKLLGDPQERLPCIHIAGTKGKGSTAVMLAEILSSAGYKVGLYTSPHVESFEERMQVSGERPTSIEIVDLVRRVQSAVRHCEADVLPFSPTFFEVATALAWLFFERRRAQIVILEVGLGGRLDSTNICRPIVSLVTSISRDHTQLLGTTLSQIAREKAGIIKPQTPVISGVIDHEAKVTIDEVCRQQQTELWQLGRDFDYRFDACGQLIDTNHDGRRTQVFGTVDVGTPASHWKAMPLTLAGEHQAHNAAVALAAVDRIRQCGWEVALEAANRGLANVHWPMRIEVICREPTVIVDAAHNWESISALGRTIEQGFATKGPSSRRALIFAATKDKDVTGLARQLLPRFDSVILTQYLNNPRAVAVNALSRLVHSLSDIPCHVANNPAEAWQTAQKITTPNDLICVTGSFFIAAELRELITQSARDKS